MTRYVVAGAISVALHLSFMLFQKEQQVFAMPSGSTSQMVSLNFVAQREVIEPEPQTNHSRPAKQTKTEKSATSNPNSPSSPKQTTEALKQATQKTSPLKKAPKKVEPTPNQTDTKKSEQSDEASKKEPAATRDASQPAVNSGVNHQPILLEQPSFLTKPVQPKYPRIARKRGIEGVATYEIWLDEQGQQVKQVLISSSGATILDRSALEAIKEWQFSAHIVNGVAMAHRIHIPVRFKLD
ncbi:energy transducer TonB [Vibrio hangzhouensis]|uniref:energy transducer TonB n=1 Tax=Vibrio hangzhouensis TaxID=462991 RepID=UPI0021BC265E|nr:energy transducer TonB [Vibrio hangzhouensis]